MKLLVDFAGPYENNNHQVGWAFACFTAYFYYFTTKIKARHNVKLFLKKLFYDFLIISSIPLTCDWEKLTSRNFEIKCTIMCVFKIYRIFFADISIFVNGIQYHALREKCPNTEVFLVRIFLYSNLRTGGVCLYFKDHLSFALRPNLTTLDGCLICEIQNGSKYFFLNSSVSFPKSKNHAIFYV